MQRRGSSKASEETFDFINNLMVEGKRHPGSQAGSTQPPWPSPSPRRPLPSSRPTSSRCGSRGAPGPPRAAPPAQTWRSAQVGRVRWLGDAPGKRSRPRAGGAAAPDASGGGDFAGVAGGGKEELCAARRGAAGDPSWDWLQAAGVQRTRGGGLETWTAASKVRARTPQAWARAWAWRRAARGPAPEQVPSLLGRRRKLHLPDLDLASWGPGRSGSGGGRWGCVCE